MKNSEFEIDRLHFCVIMNLFQVYDDPLQLLKKKLFGYIRFFI